MTFLRNFVNGLFPISIQYGENRGKDFCMVPSAYTSLTKPIQAAVKTFIWYYQYFVLGKAIKVTQLITQPFKSHSTNVRIHTICNYNRSPKPTVWRLS